MNRWEKLEQYLVQIEKEYNVPGGEIMVIKDRETIFSKTFGDRTKEEYAKNDLYWLYSMTKVYTAVSMMQLWERGLIDLEQSVIEFFPELKELEMKDEEGKLLHIENVKVRNLLSMTGGLSYDTNGAALQELRAKADVIPPVEDVVKAIFQSAFIYEPGTRFRYSMCHDVCGAIVEKVTGLRLDEYMKQNIFEPLGITDLGFFPTEEQQARFIPQYGYEGEKMLPRSNENQIAIAQGFCCGGSGLFGNLEDYIKLAEALSNMGKAANGVQILKEETINKLREDQLSPLGVLQDLHNYFPNHGLDGFSYGLGVRTRIEYVGNSPVGEFGWDGAAGGFIMIDPANHLAMGYLQHVVNMGKVYSDIHPTLRKILYEALEL